MSREVIFIRNVFREANIFIGYRIKKSFELKITPLFNIEAFLSALGLIFLAELGDKTQLMVVTIAAQKGTPFRIGVASSLGISLVAIIGIIIGFFFSIFISPFWIKIVGAIIFLAFGIYTLIKLKINEKKQEIEEKPLVDPEKIGKENRKIFLLAFFNVFVMEFGDKTQIMTITLTATYFAPVEVGLGAILALSSLCFIGAYLGGLISKKLPQKWIDLGAAIFFIVMGIILIIEALLIL
jgi:putative Ca2+/H+ antiporter (TMEM165/GDT1 family)